MSILGRDISIYLSSGLIGNPVMRIGTAVTDASGIARFYLTSDGTPTGAHIFNNVYGANIGVSYTNPVFYNQSISGTSYVEVHVRQQQFNLVTVLGISVVGSVSMANVSGATVKFTVIGD